MNKEQFLHTKKFLLEKMAQDAADFMKECFGFEMLAASLPLQSAIKYPLLSFFEFSRNGSYAKRHQPPLFSPEQVQQPFSH